MRKSLSLLTIFAALLVASLSISAPPPGKGGGGGGGEDPPPPPAPFTYTYEPLPAYPNVDSTDADAMNVFGEVVGTAFTFELGHRAIVWRPNSNGGWDTPVLLLSLLDPAIQDEWYFVGAFDINDLGQIVGSADYDDGTGFQRVAYRMTLPPDSSSYATIEMITNPGDYLNAATLTIANNGDMSVNVQLNTGRIVSGYYSPIDYDGNGNTGLELIDIQQLAGLSNPGRSYAGDVSHVFNANGTAIGIQIVGWYEDETGGHLGYRYTAEAGSELVETFVLPGADVSCGQSEILACNDYGAVCGWSHTSVQINKKRTACEKHAIFATSESDVVDLGTGASSRAIDLNNGGDMVGYVIQGPTFVVDGGTGDVFSLNGLVTNVDLSSVTYVAQDITDAGDVLCRPGGYGGASSFVLIRSAAP